MNLDNIEEILEMGLEVEGEHFEEWYLSILEKPIETIKHPYVDLEDVEELIGFLSQQRELWNEDGTVAHIYFNYLLLLKDWIDEH